MPNEPTSRWARPTRNARDAYPKDLAALVAARWEYRSGASDPPDRDPIHPLPEASVLEGALSACYQASLLREEESPVIFRLALCGPEAFPDEGGPPDGLQRLEFPEPRRFDAQELRRLSAVTDYPRSIVGPGTTGSGACGSGASCIPALAGCATGRAGG